ncbi:MAG: thiol-disulfide oxidoreductase DCC family protein [Weeksellaceae bacterium]|nr:thiol-disulfide oxidoreductase DCC family protein [Weeksellaceae bacterium]
MESHKIILFDGVCNLCNSFVQRIIRNDSKNIFKFASLQSDYGQKFLKENSLESTEFKSIILIDGNRYYTKSTAALRIGKELKGIYRLSILMLIVPKFIRDFVYDIISKNRYKWFGKQDSCWLPTPELTKKFIN